jgi:GalNAc-alpha-(1->4)-GalNAc-alpha-(1->3)-diNAcBac-PP-undecaprenol alpha-1,4-N-acetyl-D-galactosaminyltransferase
MRSREKTKPSRITLIINSMGSGGAARVMCNMATYWVERGREVTLITLNSVQQDFYAIHPDVRRVGLGLTGCSRNFAAAIGNNLPRLRRLRQEIKASRPDIVLSFVDTTNVLTLASTVGLAVPVIAAEHIDPRQYAVSPVWQALRRLVYPRAAGVVVLTDSVRPWAEGIVKKSAVHVIPNSVTVSAIKHNGVQKQSDLGGTIAAMGRLVPQKGFDLLLKAFGLCAREHPDWSLVILGEGEERSRLEALICELGIKDRVSLPGQVRDPSNILSKADIFVLASRYEGFPMALVEAMSCKLAVISTDCDSGPREMIRDGVNGILVPPNDVNALASAMDRLMKNRRERERFGARAVDVIDRFSVERVMGMWDDLLTRACGVSNT